MIQQLHFLENTQRKCKKEFNDIFVLYVYHSTIHNRQDREKIQMPINDEWVKKKSNAYIQRNSI